jgi:hypothetical protein
VLVEARLFRKPEPSIVNCMIAVFVFYEDSSQDWSQGCLVRMVAMMNVGRQDIKGERRCVPV